MLAFLGSASDTSSAAFSAKSNTIASMKVKRVLLLLVAMLGMPLSELRSSGVRVTTKLVEEFCANSASLPVTQVTYDAKSLGQCTCRPERVTLGFSAGAVGCAAGEGVDDPLDD